MDDDFALGEVKVKVKKGAKNPETLFSEEQMNELIDNFEIAQGFKKPKVKVPKVIYKNILLSPGTDEADSNFLYALMNDPELYHIIQSKDTWTRAGVYKVFLIYTEDQDVKAAREKEKVETAVTETI